MSGNVRSKGKSGPKGRRRGKGSKPSSAKVDHMILGWARATGSTTNVVVGDTALRRQNFNIVQVPPPQFGNQTFWARLTLADLLYNTSNITVQENNLGFSASSFNGFAQAAAFFDQYCIYAVTVSFYNNTVPGTLPGIFIYSAIDYDSIANIGAGPLQAYTSFNESVLGSDGKDSLVRLIKPCIAPQVTSAINLPIPAGVARAWIDAAYTSVVHYGLRVILPIAPSSVTSAVRVTVSAVFGFRNNQ